MADRSELELLRAAMTRSVEREGIPMIAALIDERGTIPPVVEGPVLEDGAALADRMLAVRDELGPSMADGDNGGVISALLIAAFGMTGSQAADV